MICQDVILIVEITITSELAFNKLSDKLKTLFKEVHAEYKPYTPSGEWMYDFLFCFEVLISYQNIWVSNLYTVTVLLVCPLNARSSNTRQIVQGSIL